MYEKDDPCKCGHVYGDHECGCEICGGDTACLMHPCPCKRFDEVDVPNERGVDGMGHVTLDVMTCDWCGLKDQVPPHKWKRLKSSQKLDPEEYQKRLKASYGSSSLGYMPNPPATEDTLAEEDLCGDGWNEIGKAKARRQDVKRSR